LAASWGTVTMRDEHRAYRLLAAGRVPDLDLIGPIELQLDAACTAPDTAFIGVLQDLDENENAINVTGYLRASLREVDEAASKRGAPILLCRTFEALPIAEKVSYRIPLVPNARHFRAGHKLRLYITTDDQNADRPALLEFRYASIGTSSLRQSLLVCPDVMPIMWRNGVRKPLLISP
jgi:predicted acyl esterase